MFRDDVCTIKRPAKTVVEGETIWGEPEAVYENIPCHLSVKSLSRVEQSSSTATVLLDYTLFIDLKTGVTINKNDIVEVTTGRGEKYFLRAGESHKYPLTIQTHCEDTSVA
ncbi:MAG: hypothetical protein KHX03_09685 [Clostridium sp.]|nr:hypothetical protein [Clostridium sp.]